MGFATTIWNKFHGFRYIYMFPKSIGELSDSVISNIANSFAKKKNDRNKFCLCASIRNNEGYKEANLRKINHVCNGIFKNGYKLLGNSSGFCSHKNDRGILYYDRNYRYPENVISELIGLSQLYHDSNNCRYKNSCTKCIDRYPTLRTGEICYIVFAFERRYAY